MIIKEVYEKYGSVKYLNRAKRSDFSKFHPVNHYVYKNIHLRIDYDRYNDRWLYASDDIDFNGVFVGSFIDLLNTMKYDINYILSGVSLYDTLLEVKSR